MKLIVMLIATGVHGPATLQGFTTLQACENARPLVTEFYKQAIKAYTTKTACLELPN